MYTADKGGDLSLFLEEGGIQIKKSQNERPGGYKGFCEWGRAVIFGSS